MLHIFFPRGNITKIEVSGTIVPPLECYRTVLQDTKKLKVDYYDGMYSIKVNKSGTFWCEDSRHIPSNRLSIFLQAGIKIAEYVPPERIIPKCPAQTTKDENGLVLEWPSISVGMDALGIIFLSYIVIIFTSLEV